MQAFCNCDKIVIGIFSMECNQYLRDIFPKNNQRLLCLLFICKTSPAALHLESSVLRVEMRSWKFCFVLIVWLQIVSRCLANCFRETQFLFHELLQTGGVHQSHLFRNQIFDFMDHRRFRMWNSSGTRPFYLKLFVSSIRFLPPKRNHRYSNWFYRHFLIMSPDLCFTFSGSIYCSCAM